MCTASRAQRPDRSSRRRSSRVPTGAARSRPWRAAPRRVPLRNVSRRSQSRDRRRSISSRTNSIRRRVALGEAPVEPGDLVVLAIGVVVAALRAGRTRRRPAASARPATGTASRAGCAPAARAARVRPGSSVGPSTPQFQLRLCAWPSGCRSRGWPRCAARCRTRGRRSVKPSCAATKLTLAVGLRPCCAEQVARAGEALRERADQRRGRRARTRASCRGSDRSTPTSRPGSGRAGSRRGRRPRARRSA